MTYINFITGLIIAAVLSVPGTMQHEAPQVGDEPEKMTLNKERNTVVVTESTSLYWYLVSDDRTIGSHQFFGTKSDVMAIQGCKDESEENCLYGSLDDDIPEDTDVSGEPNNQLIKRNSP